MTPFHLVHRLWTKAVGTPGYIKAEWMAMERMILALEEREKIVADVYKAWEDGATDLSGAYDLIKRIRNRQPMDPNADGSLPDHADSFKEVLL